MCRNEKMVKRSAGGGPDDLSGSLRESAGGDGRRICFRIGSFWTDGGNCRSFPGERQCRRRLSGSQTDEQGTAGTEQETGSQAEASSNILAIYFSVPETGGDLFRIETVQEYPGSHEALF